MARRDGGLVRATEASEQLLAFSRGLHPILLRADPVAFRRYLAEWEDVIGDTAELAATPPEQLRRTMAALLRRPQQFGLPPWPPAVPHGPPPPVSDQTTPPAREPAAPARPTRLTRPAAPPPPSPPQRAPSPPAPASRLDRGVYQLDMLTGELVPVPESSAAVAEGAPAPYEVSPIREGGSAQPRRRRRRRVPPGMEQLALWSGSGSGSSGAGSAGRSGERPD